ncbi:F0F1 ATP synthase subunit epsilon [bacterium]|nr:F0F1 ATP synthase subunit epsilon [bacterium]
MASENTFPVTVASVSETLFDGAAVSISVPAADGVMTVLAKHEPFVTTLKKGDVTVRAGGEVRTFPIEGGVFECSGEKAIVLL